jgi:FlaG/FlaF family flagellin (archaellin)
VTVIVEGKKYRALSQDCRAVSEVIGQVLMLAIVVLAFSSLAVLVFSDEGAMNPPHTPKADLQENVDTGADLVRIYHKGGEAIDLQDAKIILNINGQQEEFDLSSDPGVNCNTTNNVLMVGDDIVINTSLSRGRDLNSTDSIDMYFVHTGSDQVIQRVTLQNGNEESGSSDDTEDTNRYWITPYPNGTANDTSNGWISTEAVDEIGDGIFTTYYPSDKKDGDTNSTAQIFNFNINPTEEGISEPPFENVTLRIVYSLHDKNYDYIALDIWDGNPEEWIRVESDMPEYNKNFEARDIDLTSYVTSIEEIEAFKVRIVAVTNADKNADKTAWIDFLGIHIE